MRGRLLEFEQVAAAVIAQAGYDYPVRVELEDTQFPTKEYDGFTLPAGEYLALRVLIGEAKGQNWWVWYSRRFVQRPAWKCLPLRWRRGSLKRKFA